MESHEEELDEERLSRISSLLVRLNQPSQSRQTQTRLETLLSSDRNESVLNTAELLSRVQAFLPRLRTANQDLLQRARENPSSVDIESFQGDEDAYIQLNLGLGLFEQRLNEDANEEDDAASSSGDSTDTTDTSDSSTSSQHETTSEGSEGPDLIALVTGTRPMRPLPNRRRRQTQPQDAHHDHHPGIVVLSSTSDNGEPQRSDAPPETEQNTSNPHPSERLDRDKDS